jgi:hypothetical protein
MIGMGDTMDCVPHSRCLEEIWLRNERHSIGVLLTKGQESHRIDVQRKGTSWSASKRGETIDNARNP